MIIKQQQNQGRNFFCQAFNDNSDGKYPLTNFNEITNENFYIGN